MACKAQQDKKQGSTMDASLCTVPACAMQQHCPAHTSLPAHPHNVVVTSFASSVLCVVKSTAAHRHAGAGVISYVIVRVALELQVHVPVHPTNLGLQRRPHCRHACATAITQHHTAHLDKRQRALCAIHVWVSGRWCMRPCVRARHCAVLLLAAHLAQPAQVKAGECNNACRLIACGSERRLYKPAGLRVLLVVVLVTPPTAACM
jgi:hypothetical protein